ncbi:MAG: cytochrome c biogenesis protein CcsA [Anaerolineae bacterium]
MAAQNIQSAPSAMEPARTSPVPRALQGLTVITVLTVIVGVFMALGYAGQETTQGDVQRIFYIHMPAFFGAFIAFSATVVGGIMYLRTRQLKWDVLAVAGVEVGLVLGLINLTTGSIWARPIWNTWWTWDPRLTSAAVMSLTYMAYLMLRAGIENPDQRRRFASVYGIIAISTVIMTLIIIRIRPDTIHPAAIGSSPQNAQGEVSLTSSMITTLLTNLPVWGLLVPVTLMWWRIRLENLRERIDGLKVRLVEK